MPELPEVETIRRDLDKEIVDRRVKSVEVKAHRSVRRHRTSKDFITRLEGRKVKAVVRKGKYLLVKLDDGNVLVVHLGMSGQLLRAQTKDPVEKHTHVTITFTQGGQLRFVDPRTFGELFVTTPERAAHLQKERPQAKGRELRSYEWALSGGTGVRIPLPQE